MNQISGIFKLMLMQIIYSKIYIIKQKSSQMKLHSLKNSLRIKKENKYHKKQNKPQTSITKAH